MYSPLYIKAQELIAKFNNLPSERLYRRAVACLGKDVAPTQNEYGCAEAVNHVHKLEFGDEIGGDVSTTKLYDAIRKRDDFVNVAIPRRGDIIISPTGYGNGRIYNGHTGYVHDNGNIMSNDSRTGLFLINYTIRNWKKTYGEIGGFPCLFYRKIK